MVINAHQTHIIGCNFCLMHNICCLLLLMLLCTLIIHNFHNFFKTFLVLGMKATMVKRVQTDLKEMVAMATMLAMLLAASTSCIWRL